MTVMEPEILSLWINYAKEPTIKSKHKIMLNYIWLVKYVLQQMHLPSNSILEEQDFLNIGILGLHESIERFELHRGVKFESYAIPRIRGIIQDELRKLDWLSRTARKKAHDYIQANDTLRMSEGREVSSEEIMMKLNVTPEKYQTYLQAAAAAKASLSLFESQIQQDDEETDMLQELPDTSQENRLSIMEGEERIGFLTSYLKNLSERKRLVMTLYYYESLTFKEIGQVLNVSESRICQIHTQVIKDMRKKLNEFDNA
jgi:RNA polymerase sigma factor FliA